jgi:hypothetical protein
MAPRSWSFSSVALRTAGTVARQEELDISSVAGRQRQVEQLRRSKPGESGVFVASRLAGDRRRHKHDQERRVGIGDAEVWFCHGFHVDAKFLGEFAASGRLVIFVGFDFAAGEFPEAAVAFVSRPLTDEKAIVAFSDCRDHADT